VPAPVTVTPFTFVIFTPESRSVAVAAP
jgi:hypothetical protein